MKIVVLQENLIKKLNIVGKALSSRITTISAINNFFLTAGKDGIWATASDLETTIKTKVPGKIEEEGEALINAKTTLSFLSPLAGEKIVIAKEKGGVRAEGTKTKIVLKTENPEDFPKTPLGKTEKKTTLVKETLEETAKKICFSASTDEARGVLTGVYFGCEEKRLDIAATDGFRMSFISKPQKNTDAPSTFVLPARVVLDLFSILKEEGKEEIAVEFTEGDKQVVFSTPETQVITRLLEGEFPNFRKIIPESAGTTLVFNREEVLKAVKIASIFARDAANVVRLKNEKDGLFLYASSPHTGENQTRLEAKIEGEKKINIAFNFRFLLDLLNSSEEEEVVFKTNGPLAPGVFQFPKNPDFLHIIMPVRLQEGENP